MSFKTLNMPYGFFISTYISNTPQLNGIGLNNVATIDYYYYKDYYQALN